MLRSWFAVGLILMGSLATVEAGRNRGRGSESGLPSIRKKTDGLEAHEGLLRFFTDHDAGKIWLEIPPPAGPRGVAADRADKRQRTMKRAARRDSGCSR